MHVYPQLVPSKLCENLCKVSAHDVLPHPVSMLHMQLILDILLCTPVLYGWGECLNMCVCVCVCV